MDGIPVAVTPLFRGRLCTISEKIVLHQALLLCHLLLCMSRLSNCDGLRGVGSIHAEVGKVSGRLWLSRHDE
jgi:hypothetical protein